MTIAINDISFHIPFSDRYKAKEAFLIFAEVLACLRDSKVSKVSDTSIIVCSSINKNLIIAPKYTLLDAVKTLINTNRELALFLLAKLTTQGYEIQPEENFFSLLELQSSFCARHKDDFLLSIISHPVFEKNTITGSINENVQYTIKNIAKIEHIYDYWNDLGFREYELNPKHGKREYIRANGLTVGVAPESDEKGQQLLNIAVEIANHLYSVDKSNCNRIFEFRWSYANKFHGFSRDDLPKDLENKIKEIFDGSL